MYSSLLVGHQSARRRFDMDKQAVLLQISELDFCDLFPIVLSCQFSLCIFYARAAFIRILRIITRFGNSSDSPDGSSALTSLSLKFRDLLLTSCNDLCYPDLVDLIGVCFKQGLGASSQPEKLFPSLLQVFIIYNQHHLLLSMVFWVTGNISGRPHRPQSPNESLHISQCTAVH